MFVMGREERDNQDLLDHKDLEVTQDHKVLKDWTD